MKARLIVVAMLLCLPVVASAHRLDEYLQATMLTVKKGRVEASMRMIPGVAVSSAVIAEIDRDGNGVFSETERKAYAERVIRGLTMRLDGEALKLRLVSEEFPPVAEIMEGVGEIHLSFDAEMPRGGGDHRLTLENRNADARSVYLVNCLMPSDPDIRVAGQQRNATQSTYELDFVEGGAPAASGSVLSAGEFARLFRLGISHIAEGTDHLLFLLVLLLPAPLLVVGSRWAGPASIREGLLRIVKVVTAFTLGHSITLAMAAFGAVHVASRPIEVLIAFSILVSAVHAVRPIFPGKEAGVAAFFGLIHGLAFASTLRDVGLGGWALVAGVLGFNLGIETMQMIVVVATMPSLVLLSRTRIYGGVRVCGAALAGVAALGWIAERTLGLRSGVDGVVGLAAGRALWIAVALLALSVVVWGMQRLASNRVERACLPSVREV